MSGRLAGGQTGNGDTAVLHTVAHANQVLQTHPRAIAIITTVGGAPTVTVKILGSPDGVNFFPLPYALPATPTTFVTTDIVITAADTFLYLLSEPVQPNPYQLGQGEPKRQQQRDRDRVPLPAQGPHATVPDSRLVSGVERHSRAVV